MLDGRLYRAAFVPLLLVLVVVGFSLKDRPRPYTTTLAPDVFDGKSAFAILRSLGAQYPDRRPGSTGDQGLAQRVAASFRRAGFGVSTHETTARTIDGRQTLTTVIGERPGRENRRIVLLAHRDAAGHGAAAELSGTAALLELAQALQGRFTQRTVTLVSTSGGSGGDAGAVDFARQAGGPIDAVLVLGDMAGTKAHKPFVQAWSEGLGGAPQQLRRTLDAALTQEVGTSPGGPSFSSQFSHLAFPLAVGEQGVLNARGMPAALIQVSGERGPPADERVDQDRLQNFGRGVLRAVNSLDSAPDLPLGQRPTLALQRKLADGWAIRLLIGALLLPPLLASIDAFARVRRRREPVGRWLRWVLSAAAPFLGCALVAVFLRVTSVIHAPATPIFPRASPVGSTARIALGVVLVLLVLGLAAWTSFTRRLRPAGARPDTSGAGAALLLVMNGLALVVWFFNPFTAALLVPALHLWLMVASPELRPRAPIALALVAAGLVLPALVIVSYVHELALGPAQTGWMALLLVAGGHIGLLAALLWSVALGCLAAATAIALQGGRPPSDMPEITVRGPLTYAGPGSLGGTESALRR